MELGIIKWAIDFIAKLTGGVGERRRRFISDRVGPLEAYFSVAFAGLDLMRGSYVGRDDGHVANEDLDHTRALFLEMAADLAPMRHGATAAANAIGDDQLIECWRETEKMLLVLSTFLQLAREVREPRHLVRSVFDDAVAPITKGQNRIRRLLT